MTTRKSSGNSDFMDTALSRAASSATPSIAILPLAPLPQRPSLPGDLYYAKPRWRPACAAGCAVQRIVEREQLVKKVAVDGSWFLDTLSAELEGNRYIGDIRGRGFFIGVEFVADRVHKTPFDSDLQLFGQIRNKAHNQ